MKTEDLALATEFARSVMYPEYVTRDSCIAMSRLMVEVCRYFGRPATAHRAVTYVLNAKATELVESEQIKMSEELPKWAEDAGAWALGIGTPLPGGGAGLHVVVISGDTLIDASLDQASRPERDINLEAGIMPYHPDQPILSYSNEAGCSLWYKILDDTDSFKASPDWKLFKQRYSKAAAAVIREMKGKT